MATQLEIHKRKDGTKTWLFVGRFNNGRITRYLQLKDRTWIRARLVRNGVIGKSRVSVIDPIQDKVEDRPSLSNVTVPKPKVKHNNGVIDIIPVAPASVPEDEYEAEVRIGESLATEQETVLVGTVTTGQPITVNAIPATENVVHTRIFNKADGTGSDWQSTTIYTPETPAGMAAVEDFAGTDIEATGTIDPVYGYTPLENGSGVIQNAAVPSIWNTTNTDSIWGMSGDVPIWALRKYFPYGRYETAAFDATTVHSFLPQFHPEVDSVTNEAVPIWGMSGYPAFDRRDVEVRDPEGDYLHFDYDTAQRGLCIWNTSNEGDRQAIELEKEIALSQDGSAPITFAKLVEGHWYRARQVKYAFIFRSRFGRKQIKLTRFRLRRCLWNRKYEKRVALSLDGSGDQTYTFPSDWEFTTTPAVQVQMEDTTPLSNTTYIIIITATSTTAVTFRVREDDGSTVPGVTDKSAIIQAMGY